MFLLRDCDIYFLPINLHSLTQRGFVNFSLISLKSTLSQFNMERVILPMHIRRPSPNRIYSYEYLGRLLWFFSVKRSGSKISVSGKYWGSFWVPNTVKKIGYQLEVLLFHFRKEMAVRSSWNTFDPEMEVSGIFSKSLGTQEIGKINVKWTSCYCVQSFKLHNTSSNCISLTCKICIVK